jgi:hypothetical protein
MANENKTAAQLIDELVHNGGLPESEWLPLAWSLLGYCTHQNSKLHPIVNDLDNLLAPKQDPNMFTNLASSLSRDQELVTRLKERWGPFFMGQIDRLNLKADPVEFVKNYVDQEEDIKECEYIVAHSEEYEDADLDWACGLLDYMRMKENIKSKGCKCKKCNPS